jgi:hypothetical protein
MRVYLNGQPLRSKKEWTPLVRQVVRSIEQRRRYFWILLFLSALVNPLAAVAQAKLATGIGIFFANVGAFTPTLHVYTSGTSATETIPTGANTCEIECWGGGGGGGTAGTNGGGGGGGGAYSRCTLTVTTSTGKTFAYTVGAAVAELDNGSTSSISAGTISGFDTVTCTGGTAGQASGGGGTGGAGGTANNSNSGATNTSGNAGSSHSGNTGGAGGAGITGNISGDGSPYGAGGNGGTNGGSGAGGGGAGACVFYYSN